MQCVRCGATFDGSFCPRCGTPAPATALPAGYAASSGWPCPRCGTVFRGHFCPRCGLPTAAWAYRSPPSPSGGRSVLSILWTLAMVGFLILALTDFAALLWSPTMVVPGIQGIQSGANVNSGLDFDGNAAVRRQWTSSCDGNLLPEDRVHGPRFVGPGERGFRQHPPRVDDRCGRLRLRAAADARRRVPIARQAALPGVLRARRPRHPRRRRLLCVRGPKADLGCDSRPPAIDRHPTPDPQRVARDRAGLDGRDVLPARVHPVARARPDLADVADRDHDGERVGLPL